MLEVVAAVAALINASQLSIKVLLNRQDAPVAIAELANQLQSFNSMVVTIKDQRLENEMVKEELLRAEKTLARIKKLLQAHIFPDQRHLLKAVSKFRWAFKEREKAETLLRDLNAHTSTLGILLNTETMKSLRQFSDTSNASEIVIAVMGLTGSGKTQLIQQITQSREAKVGHTLSSETQHVRAYPITVDNRVITLVDTPGFDDTNLTDREVLGEIVSWLTDTYMSRRLLSGIIYLHPITDSRMRGSAVSGLDVFSRLVGVDSFHNILLVTTKWDLLLDSSVGELREEELRERFWKPLIEKGSITTRSYGDRKSALAIMERVAFDQRMALTSGAPLKIQKEIVDEQKPLEATSAGEALARRLDEVEHLHRDQLQEMERENKLERNRMQMEIHKLREEQARLKTGMAMMQDGHGQPQSKQPNMNTDIFASMTAEDLLTIGPPPPYAPREHSTVRELIESLGELIAFSLRPMHELHGSLIPLINRVVRPGLSEGYSRIEWKCSCGVVLFGDYIERSQGSLQNLAAQLKGRVIAGPALQSPPNALSQSSRALSQAHLGGQPSMPVPGGAAGQYSNFIQTPNPKNQPTVAPGVLNALSIQPPSVTPKWLELCIRSSADTYQLGEIDITGGQTDQVVFYAIREKYRSKSVAAQPFHRFALRTPNGGVFVQFRKDKIATPHSSTATISVMKRPSVPTPQEARDHRYVFEPVPMDEPPIDSRTFNHYFQYPHLGDSSETWIKRFPQLQDSSLFYSNEKLAKGWGIKITESRNWMLFICTNILVLLLTGLIAGLYSYYTKDPPTGVAIGAWLSAVQTLGVSALFLHWTSK